MKRHGRRWLAEGLPADPSIEALDARSRRLAADVWLTRAGAERGVSRRFADVARALLDHDASLDVQHLAARAIADELEHAELCRALAERFAGRALSIPPSPPGAATRVSAPPELKGALQVIATCCVQETLGAAYLEHALGGATEPAARYALRALLADEVDHSRIGWAFLASLDPALRATISPHLEPLVDACLRSWRSRLETYPAEGVASHGCPASAATGAAIEAAARDLVWPGFAHLGATV